MKKTLNKEAGEVTFSFTDKEIKKLKILSLAGAAVFILSLGTAAYAAVSMSSLKSENELYRNQLKMAEEKNERPLRQDEDH